MNPHDDGPRWPDEMKEPAAATAPRRGAIGDGAEPPRIRVGSGPDTVRVLSAAINSGALPEVYVSDGRLTSVEQVSGTAGVQAADKSAPLPVTASTITPALLARLLADHTFTYREKGTGDVREEEIIPSADARAAILAGKTWPGRPALRGIIGAPVLRPDGTLLQKRGYDPATGLYLAPTVELPQVPDAPAAKRVTQALDFLLDRFLHDFPWKSPADRANYVALLITPIVRRFLRDVLSPFGLITASMPASGKTILTSGPGLLYGQRVFSWTHNEDELRKTVTGAMETVEGTIIFDNLEEGAIINSAVLARLITGDVWSDRRLGSNKVASFPNNRLWLATGNNLSVGGDMASRTVLVQIDPNMPRPEQRSNFALGRLDEWILESANRATLLGHLLVLVLDWTRAGAPRARVEGMRQFTSWAAGAGGFLEHHGIKDFLGNADAVREIDEDDATWRAFLATWHRKYGEQRLTAHELRTSAEPDYAFPGPPRDPWDGVFLTDARSGKVPNPKSLGRMLRGHVDRFHGEYRLRKVANRENMSLWWVEKHSPADARSSAERESNPSNPSNPANGV